MIRTIIVEDERHSLERLKSLVAELDIDVVGEAMDGETAVALINSEKPDLVFLDIQLPVYNGFEVLERLTHKPHIIFVTSYNQFAIKAFEENAVDYILKPTSKERLQKSIQRVLDREPSSDENLLTLLKQKIFPEYRNRFAIKLKDEILIIPAEDVVYFKAEDRCVFLGTEDGEFIIDATLKELEGVLDPDTFIRVSKSAIVAVDLIAKFTRWFVGDFMVKLNDNNTTSFKIGRTFLPRLRDRFHF